MFKQKIFPEGFDYTDHVYTFEDLFKAIETGEIVQGRLAYIAPNFNYAIVDFGEYVAPGYINGKELHDINPKFAGCLLGNIINVHVREYNKEKGKFVCTRREIIRDARNFMDKNYQVGHTIKCKILYIDTFSMFAIVDIGNGVTVKMPYKDLGYNVNNFQVNDFVDLTIRKCEKSPKYKHKLFALTIREKIGIVIPITFESKKGNQWYGSVNGNLDYPTGKIVGLHQKAIYEIGDTHSCTLIDYDDNNTPIYKLN